MRFFGIAIFLGLSSLDAQTGAKSTAGHSDQLRSLVARAEAAEQQNRLDEAISLYEQILRIRPGWASAELNLGLVYHSRADYSKAILTLSKALQHNPNLQSALLFRGASYYHTGRYADAIRDLKQYLPNDAGSEEALSYLGNAQLANNAPGEAAAAFATLAHLSGEPSAYFQLVDCYVRLARSLMQSLTGEEAESFRRRIMAAESSGETEPCELPGELPSPSELTSVRCDADRFEFEKATLALTKIVRQPKLPQQTIFESVGACQRLARAAVTKVITLAPESTWAGLLRAQAAEKSGDIETVEKEYERAITAPNASLESYVRYGQFESKHSRYERALALYEQALAIEPNNPRVLGLIGEAHALQDKSEKAIPYLEKALLANPHETQTRLYLAQSLVRLKRLAEAVRILEVAPEDPDGRIHYLLGRTYQQMGANEKARKAMDEFRRLRKEPEP